MKKTKKWCVENYNFAKKCWTVMNLVNAWKGTKVAIFDSKDDADYIKELALCLSGGSIKVRVSRSKP